MAQERKGGLGRGLAALIPSSTESADKTGKTGRLGDGAADVMAPAGSSDREEGSVTAAPTTPIREVMAASVATGKPVLVEDAGEIVGAITSEAILKAILGK